MTSGRPDYTSVSLIRGLEAGTTLRTVAVDASGNLIAVIEGTDGTTLRQVKVDTLGQLIAILKGASGNDVAVDGNGFLAAAMKGNYAGNLVTLAVDSSGNILGVLQGDYAGSLKTLAVDSQGRILAVLTDPEDVFGNPHYMGAAELAVRLGAAARYDRRGQVIYSDPGGVNAMSWYGVLSGAGTKFEEYTGEGMTLPAAAAYHQYVVAGGYCTSGKIFPRLSTTPCGIEVLFAFEPLNQKVDFYMAAFDKAHKLLGGIRFDMLAGKYQRWTSAGAWADIGTIPFTVDAGYPHNIKLVIDPATAKYVRLVLDGVETDLSAQDLQSVVDTHGPAIQFLITTTAAAGSDADTYLSNIVVTCNEE